MIKTRTDSHDASFKKKYIFNIRCLLFSVAMWTFIILAHKLEPTINYIFLLLAIITYILYIWESFDSEILKFIKHELPTFFNLDCIEKMKKGSPIIEFRTECFHYDDEKAEDGLNSEIITLNNREYFTVLGWEDNTGSLDSINISQFILIEIKIDFEFGDENLKLLYETRKNAHYRRHSFKDIHARQITQWKIEPMYQKFFISPSRENHPCVINKYFFLIFTIFGVSWVYRMICEISLNRHELLIRKKIY